MIKSTLGLLLSAALLGGCVYERNDAEYRREAPPPPRYQAPPPRYQASAAQPDRVREDELSRLAPGTGTPGPEAETRRYSDEPRYARRTPYPGRIFVQAASYVTRAQAERSRRSLMHLGRAHVYTAYVDDQLRYRVRIGPMATPERSERVRAALVRRGYADAMIVRD